MSLDAESVIERRRLKRRAFTWRVAAVVLGLVLLGTLLLGNRQGTPGSASFLPHVARITVSGVITDDRKVLEMIDRVGKADQVRAVILDINSPGGTTTGGEALYDAIRRLADEKPVVATCGTLATSAAYIVALATDRIFVYGNTITGSVGVIFQWANVTELLKTLGIEFQTVKSGPLKAVPNPFEPTDERAREVTKEMVDDAKTWFFGLVEDRREVSLDDIPGLTEGRIYSGRQAVDYKLADQIGDERAALGWLTKERGVSDRLRVIQWKPRPESDSVFGDLLGSALSFLGVSGTTIGELMGQATGTLKLDGLVSLWHPASN